MRYLIPLTVLLTFSLGCVEQNQPGDDRNDAFLSGSIDGRADGNGVSESELRAILEVANTYSRHRLVADVDWHWPAADHLIDYRNGDDEVRGTDDDRVFMSLQEVDDVPYVGAVAYTRLRDYVRDNDLIEHHRPMFEDEIPESIDAAYGVAIKGTIGKRKAIKIPVRTERGDRLRFWLRKATDAQWNPRVRLSADGDRLFSENPWGTSDARFPAKGEEYEEGFLVEVDADEFVLELANTASDVQGDFEFTLECVAGPCYLRAIGGETELLDGDFEGLSEHELLKQLAANHERHHEMHTYYEARLFMFSTLDNFGGEVACVYTGDVIETETIPHYYKMSAEHTWPQSEGAISGSARTDLHHIYPVTGLSNSIRAAYPFCEVETVIRYIGPAKLGYDQNNVRCFEPADAHKGNVARSMFYFAGAYEQSIDDAQEAVLRAWNEEDPIDNEELARAEAIAEFQGSKNHFVLQSDLIERVSDF